MVIVGDKEIASHSVSLRIHGQGDKGQIEVELLIDKIKNLINNKSLETKI